MQKWKKLHIFVATYFISVSLRPELDILTQNKVNIEQNLAKFYLGMYLYDIPMPQEKLLWLKTKGYIDDSQLKNKDKGLSFSNNFRNFTGEVDSPIEQFFGETLSRDNILSIEDSLKSLDKKMSFDGSLRITKEDWTPDGLKVDYEYDFWKWINAFNEGWQYYKTYAKFELYRQQAYNWIAEGNAYISNATDEQKLDYLRLERERCLQNSLYALNKFGFLKSELVNNENGLRYSAWPAQEVALYLFDLGLSFIMGKARQIGMTSTIGAATAVRTMLKKNFNTKMVAEKGVKSEELFRDKVKYVIDKFPSYLTPTINSDSKTILQFVKKIGKGKTSGSNSIFQVEPPTITCINGGSPAIVLLDEIGLYDIFGDIISEGRPALFGLNPISGRQEMLRQVIAWGTGGNMDKGGAAMEQEYRTVKEAWLDRDFTNGFLPVFLNCFARKGVDYEFYEEQKKFYYNREQKVGEKDHKIYFHQAYPVTEDDMFLTSSDTIIATATINQCLDKIRTKKQKKQLEYVRGHFVPVYDMSVKYGEESDVPYKIIGAKFQACSDNDIIRNTANACVTMIMRPDRKWRNRYWQGTDPIFTASGFSNMGAAVFDGLLKRISCYIDMRHEDYRFCYLQCVLMKMYYGTVNGNSSITPIKDLVESNVGGEYINYNKQKGLSSSMVKNDRLKPTLQGGGNTVGIRKMVGLSAKTMITELEEMLITCIDTLDCDRFFEQLKTYVRKVTKNGKETYEPQNKRHHKDDVLDGGLYAYINYKSHERYKPELIGTQETVKYKSMYVCNASTGYQTVIKKIPIKN